VASEVDGWTVLYRESKIVIRVIDVHPDRARLANDGRACDADVVRLGLPSAPSLVGAAEAFARNATRGQKH